MATKQPKTQEVKSTILGACEEALNVAEELRDELQNWYDSLPEQLQDGSKADELQEAIDYLEEAISKLEDVQGADLEGLHQFEFTYTSKILSPSKMRHMSRAMRLEQGTEALQGVPLDLSDLDEAALGLNDDNRDDAEEMLQAVQEAIDSLQSVCFPRMFG